MKNERKIELYDSLLTLIFEHIGDSTEYTHALYNAGFTREEAEEELLNNCQYDSELVRNILNEVYQEC